MWFCKIDGNRGKRINMKKRSKRYLEIAKLKNENKKLSVKDIIDLLKKARKLNSTSQLIYQCELI